MTPASRTPARLPLIFVALLLQIAAPERLDRGRFTAVYYPADRTLAVTVVDYAVGLDTFPGLPRPRQRILIAIAPNRRLFREWIGPGAPEWGAAIAFPVSRRIVMQGRSAGSDAGDPRETLRHELAHLALHEDLDERAPRWFDEGYASYAAHEWRREDALTTNFALALRGMPTFEELERQFTGPASVVAAAYALSYRAVTDLADLDAIHGLALFFADWKTTGSMDKAMRAAYGMTLADFETRWRTRTRRRYGGLALFGDVTVAGLVLLLLVGPLQVARRRRDRERMRVMRAAEEVAEARAGVGASKERGYWNGGDGPEHPPAPEEVV